MQRPLRRLLLSLATSLGLVLGGSEALAQRATTRTSTSTADAPRRGAMGQVVAVGSTTRPATNATRTATTNTTRTTPTTTGRSATTSTTRTTTAARPAAQPSRPPANGDPERLDLPGMPGAWFYRAEGGGRQRLLVYMHSRGANPREACRKWHESTPRFGWMVCPIGPVDRGNGRREWNNNAAFGRREAMAAVAALHARFPRRTRLHDNVILGFSEGAFVAMNIGLLEPLTFPRWFIIAAHDGYMDGERSRIPQIAGSVQRVYLLTGTHDEIVERTRRANDQLTRAWGRRRVRMQILERAGHELPPEFRSVTRRALLWITQ